MSKNMFRSLSIVFTTVAACALIVPAVAKDKAKKKTEYINAYEELTIANKYAAAGAISRSVPHYLKVLKADPINYAVAHYNLAEVYKAKKKCTKAGFHYQAYIMSGRDAATKKAATAGMKACGSDNWSALTVSAKPAEANVTVNGFLFGQGDAVKSVKLPKGTYAIHVTATDHSAQKRSVELSGDQSVSVSLDKMTFYGNLGFSVRYKGKPVKGAIVKVTPKKIDKSTLKVDAMTLTTPVKKSFKLPTGKYFIEITTPGFDRWIRNVYVTRDSNNRVDISLTQSLPSEIK